MRQVLIDDMYNVSTDDNVRVMFLCKRKGKTNVSFLLVKPAEGKIITDFCYTHWKSRM